MNTDDQSARHNRQSIRLRGYDYSTEGLYFVTIVTHNRECLFGEICEGNITLNSAGRSIAAWYWETEKHFNGLLCHEMIVMPNHFHCIWQIDNNVAGQTHRSAPTRTTIPNVLQWLKTMTTNDYIKNVKTKGWMPFSKRLWQRNYYEHIIRNAQEYDMIAQYILSNPLKWAEDSLNPGLLL